MWWALSAFHHEEGHEVNPYEWIVSARVVNVVPLFGYPDDSNFYTLYIVGVRNDQVPEMIKLLMEYGHTKESANAYIVVYVAEWQ
jgi:hypothetical protein